MPLSRSALLKFSPTEENLLYYYSAGIKGMNTWPPYILQEQLRPPALIRVVRATGAVVIPLAVPRVADVQAVNNSRAIGQALRGRCDR